MTGNKCLLDTSIVIRSFKKDNDVSERLDITKEIYVPVIVIGELCYGAYKSANPAKHLTQLKSFLANCMILSADEITADIYGSIKTTLAKKGKPIPENDIWIAAFSQQHKLPLFTFDAHFSSIDSIELFK
jgi:tRNA(fMet)-specific endonuclease VapC